MPKIGPTQGPRRSEQLPRRGPRDAAARASLDRRRGPGNRPLALGRGPGPVRRARSRGRRGGRWREPDARDRGRAARPWAVRRDRDLDASEGALEVAQGRPSPSGGRSFGLRVTHVVEEPARPTSGRRAS